MILNLQKREVLLIRKILLCMVVMMLCLPWFSTAKSISNVGLSQRIATIEVNLSTATAGLDMPVCVAPDTSICLLKVQFIRRIPFPYQIEKIGQLIYTG